MITITYVRAHPGTELYREYVKCGKIEDKIRFMELRDPPIAPPAFNKDISDKVVRYAIDEDRYDGKLLSTKYMNTDTRGNLYELTVVCPHCNSTIIYKNMLYVGYLVYQFEDRKTFRNTCRLCNKKFDIPKWEEEC